MLRAVESSMYLRNLGAVFGVRGLYSDVMLLGRSLGKLLPLRNLLHPAVLATMTRAYPSFEATVISAGLKSSRAAARRINAAASVIKEEITQTRALSPADRKTLEKEPTLGSDAKQFAKYSDVAVTDPQVLAKMLRVNKLGGLVVNSESTEAEMIQTFQALETPGS